MSSKFKPGDVVVVVRNLAPEDPIYRYKVGYVFVISEETWDEQEEGEWREQGDRRYYTTEDCLEFAEIVKSPLWRALE